MNNDQTLLKVENISKTYTGIYGSKKLILDKISFSILSNNERGRINSILAPFGAGKSTLLKIISGIVESSEGNIFLNQQKSNSSINKIIYIPEKPSSFPWLNVKENIEIASEVLGQKKSGINFESFISIVGLNRYENHHPNEKSFGFRFRISLARALVCQPDLILIDDSFKIMDQQTKEEIYELVKKISSEFKINFLLATTNIAEAVILSEKIFLMKKDPDLVFKEIEIPFEKNTKINHQFYKSVGEEIEESFKSENEI
ncbi:MAG: ATP-binding cassette domain-containing protein, partial [Ignavibacteriaceae bacterium]